MNSKKAKTSARFVAVLALGLGVAAPFSALAQTPKTDAGAAAAHANGHPAEHGTAAANAAPRTLPPLPANLPAWLDNKRSNHIFRKGGAYNDDVYNLGALARDLNGVAVGHSMAYEDLVTGKADDLDTKTYERIARVLKNPPRLMPSERFISPTFGRRYGVLEQVFDWTHVLHAQIADVLVSTDLTNAQKDEEIERLYQFYATSVPYAITPLPMNMAFLDGQPYSGAFRRKYPKTNGLFWGYHWLQGVMHDALYEKSAAQQKAAYEVVGEQYRTVELFRTDRPFMPMFGEVTPRFAARFPHIANTFDNLHMLHDMVNDILATDGLTEKERQEQIKRAIYVVSGEAHKNEKAGVATEKDGLHDHRFMKGMPGMGMMKHATEDLMFMQGMGWMSMADCHHCSMPLFEGREAWRNATVTADGWTMRVRCALCARDMSAETKGRAVLHLPTEDPLRPLVMISDEQGNLKTDMTEAVLIEEEASHAKCHEWSQAFTSRAAFDAFVKANPTYKNAKALGVAAWAEREGAKPDTYYKPEGPVENPYAAKGKSEAKPR